MSTLGSSVINKSGKKFAPKAPVRRPATVSSTQHSARASVDRQNLSQTPQPQVQPQAKPHVQFAAHSQTQSELQPQSQPQPQIPYQSFSVSQPTQKSNDVSLTPPPTSIPQTSQQPAPTLIDSIPESGPQLIPASSKLANTDNLTISPIIPQKRTLENSSPNIPEPDQAVLGLEDRASAIGVGSSDQANSQEAQTQSPGYHPQPPEAPDLPTAASGFSRISSPQVLPSSNNITSPHAKRRRIQQLHGDTSSPKLPSQDDSNIPIPSTEIGGNVETQAENADAVNSIHEHSTIVQQPAQRAKPKASAKSKGKRRLEQQSADIVADVIQKSASRASKSKKPRKLEMRGQQSVENTAAEIVANAVKGSSVKKRVTKRKKVRAITPEGAAEMRIVPTKVKMSELCKNSNTGKKSTRQAELEAMDKAEATRKEQQKLEELMGTAQSSNQFNGPLESAEERLERLARAREGVVREVPETIIIDGQIQIDETSLQIDRHANAAIERDAEQLEGVDESELTRPVNAGSWLKRDKSGQWNEISTNLFYDGLRMFGTDFEMISKMFPGRTRRSVKLKFCKEEKENLQKIQDTLMGATIPVDMDQFSKMSNTVYSDPKELERDLAEDRKRLEEEQGAEKQAMDEMRLQREQEAAAEGAAVADDSSAKENQVQGDGDGESAPVKTRRGRKANGQKRSRGRKMSASKGQTDALGAIHET